MSIREALADKSRKTQVNELLAKLELTAAEAPYNRMIALIDGLCGDLDTKLEVLESIGAYAMATIEVNLTLASLAAEGHQDAREAMRLMYPSLDIDKAIPPPPFSVSGRAEKLIN